MMIHAELTLAEQCLAEIHKTPLYDGPTKSASDKDSDVSLGVWDIIRRYPLDEEEQAAAAGPYDRGDVACFADGSRLTRVDDDDDTVSWSAGY